MDEAEGNDERGPVENVMFVNGRHGALGKRTFFRFEFLCFQCLTPNKNELFFSPQTQFLLIPQPLSTTTVPV